MNTPDFCREALDHHMLTTLVETDQVQVYRMHAPGTRHLCVQLTFGPEGVSLMGDIGIGPHGSGLNYARPGRGRGWFLAATSPSYLCEKFLRPVWQAKAAADELREELAEADEYGFSPAMVEHLKGVVGDLCARGEELCAGRFYDLLTESFIDHDEGGKPVYRSYEVDDDLPGTVYDARETAWLVAIQRRFRELYLQRGGA